MTNAREIDQYLDVQNNISELNNKFGNVIVELIKTEQGILLAEKITKMVEEQDLIGLNKLMTELNDTTSK